MDDGTFVGSLVMQCRMPGATGRAAIPRIRAMIERVLKAEREIHGEPVRIEERGMRGLAFDSTSRVKESDGEVSIREEARILDDGSSELLYQTRSREVSGRGLASYLKAVGFSANARVAGEGMLIELRNDIRVERPWYALSPIFFMIAKGTAKSKFNSVKERLLPRLVSALSEQGGKP